MTTLIRDKGMPNGVIAHHPNGRFDVAKLKEMAAQWPGLIGMDLAKWPNLKAYVDRVGASPKVQEALKAEGLAA